MVVLTENTGNSISIVLDFITGICGGIVMDIAVEKMTVAEKLLAMERLWNSLQAEETFTPPDWHEQVLSERLQALRDGQVQFSPLEEVAERLRGVR
ncbi:MAG: addiction module protein, partial [Planctomycetaceae bacterium]